eukprot:11029047-Alexandrium_andersonii.AAC.1
MPRTGRAGSQPPGTPLGRAVGSRRQDPARADPQSQPTPAGPSRSQAATGTGGRHRTAWPQQCPPARRPGARPTRPPRLLAPPGPGPQAQPQRPPWPPPQLQRPRGA